MKGLPSLILLSLAVIFASCSQKSNQQGNSLAEQRAETDTILAFQGIRISEPLDSARYAELIGNGAIVLYDKDKNAFTMTNVVINGDVAYPGDIVHSLSLKGYIEKYYDFLSFICLYEESYGCFSYYQRLKQDGEKMGTFPIGKVSSLSGKPYTRMDAVSDFIKFNDTNLYRYDFIWEWNNQTIVLSFNPQSSQLNSSVTYFDTGFSQRQAEEEVQQMLKDAEERDIDAARNKQQI